MKKVFLTLIMAAICGMSSAQTLSIPDVEILAGGKAFFHLIVNVEGKEDLMGLQYENIELPEGISVTGVVTKWDNNAQFLAADTKFSAAAMPVGKTPTFFPTGEFEIGSVEIEATNEIEIGEYPVTIPANNCVFISESVNYPNAKAITFKVKVVDRLTLDENSEVAPASTGDERVNVHVARTIKANTWSTICLPIAISKSKAEEIFGNFVLGDFAGFAAEYADEEDLTPDAIVINFNKVTLTTKTGMAAGKPYIIKTNKEISGFDVDEVKIVSAPTNVEKQDAAYETVKGSFVGTFTKTNVPADGLFISDGEFWYSTGKTKTKAFRAWFALGAVLDKETEFESRVIINFIDDDATGIKNTKTFNSEEIYTLSGQRVKNAGKGVYIVNGKKVIKK